jgi:hypothetical protein
MQPAMHVRHSLPVFDREEGIRKLLMHPQTFLQVIITELCGSTQQQRSKRPSLE